MKIAVSNGSGFAISRAAMARLVALGQPVAVEWDGYFREWGDYDRPRERFHPPIDRSDPLLIRVIEEMGTEAGDDIGLIEIPDGVNWTLVDCHDGREYVAEVGREWTETGERRTSPMRI